MTNNFNRHPLSTSTGCKNEKKMKKMNSVSLMWYISHSLITYYLKNGMTDNAKITFRVYLNDTITILTGTVNGLSC